MVERETNQKEKKMREIVNKLCEKIIVTDDNQEMKTHLKLENKFLR